MMHRVSFTTINPAKLRSEADLDSDDPEVRHIPHCFGVLWPQAVDAFGEVVEHWLRETYSPSLCGAQSGLFKSQTHTGYTSTASPPVQRQQQCVDGRPPPALPRTQSSNPLLELEARPFFERSAILLRLKPPSKWGRGYGRGQPFKPEDILVWDMIKKRDWSMVIHDQMDILVFINHWFECDFTWTLLEYVIALNPIDGRTETILNGDAQLFSIGAQVASPSRAGAFVDAPVVEGVVNGDAQLVSDGARAVTTCFADASMDVPIFQHHRVCPACKCDDKPSMDTTAMTIQLAPLHPGDFCSSCRTYRHDESIWLCRGPPARTWPRSKPCNQVMQMLEVPLGVPCCSICGTVRHNFQDDDFFLAWSNSDDEPLPQRTFSAG